MAADPQQAARFGRDAGCDAGRAAGPGAQAPGSLAGSRVGAGPGPDPDGPGAEADGRLRAIPLAPGMSPTGGPGFAPTRESIRRRPIRRGRSQDSSSASPAQRRLGPRPLPQHLMLALAMWGNSAAAWPSLKAAWQSSKAGPGAGQARSQARSQTRWQASRRNCKRRMKRALVDALTARGASPARALHRRRAELSAPSLARARLGPAGAVARGHDPAARLPARQRCRGAARAGRAVPDQPLSTSST